MFSLGGNPIGHLVAFLSFIHHDIFPVDRRYVVPVMRFDGDYEVCRNAPCSRGLLTEKTSACAQHSHQTQYIVSQETRFLHNFFLSKDTLLESPEGKEVTLPPEKIPKNCTNTVIRSS